MLLRVRPNWAPNIGVYCGVRNHLDPTEVCCLRFLKTNPCCTLTLTRILPVICPHASMSRSTARSIWLQALSIPGACKNFDRRIGLVHISDAMKTENWSGFCNSFETRTTRVHRELDRQSNKCICFRLRSIVSLSPLSELVRILRVLTIAETGLLITLRF